MLGLQKQIDKQLKYEKSKAYAIISSFKEKSLKTNEILECIEVMYSNKDNNETQQEVLITAKNIVLREAEMEFRYEAIDIIPIVTNTTN